LANVTVLDYQPEELASDMLWAARIHVITMREGWQGIVVPSKLYGTLKTGAPILFIGPPDADTAAAVQEQDLGETVPPGISGAAIVEILERLAARERLPNPNIPENGPQRIAEFVCRTAAGSTGDAPPPDAMKTNARSVLR
jgi:hypothetical protein